MLRLLLSASLFALALPALAQTVVETDFEVTVTATDGTETRESTTIVPLRNGVCYTWWLRLAKTKGAVDVVEILTLPTAPAGWGDDDGTTISDDQRVATSTMSLTPTDGWIGHGWCIAKGDPEGEHQIEVKAGNTVLATFPFEIRRASN